MILKLAFSFYAVLVIVKGEHTYEEELTEAQFIEHVTPTPRTDQHGDEREEPLMRYGTPLTEVQVTEHVAPLPPPPPPPTPPTPTPPPPPPPPRTDQHDDERRGEPLMQHGTPVDSVWADMMNMFQQILHSKFWGVKIIVSAECAKYVFMFFVSSQVMQQYMYSIFMSMFCVIVSMIHEQAYAPGNWYQHIEDRHDSEGASAPPAADGVGGAEGGVLGDSLGALRDGVLGELTGEQETDSGLVLSAGENVRLVVADRAEGLTSNLLEEVVDEGVHDAHGLLGDTGLGVNLLEDTVDADGNREE